MYPSHEKLNDEIHSEPRIYETPEDLEIAMYSSMGNSIVDHTMHRTRLPIWNTHQSGQRLHIGGRSSYSEEVGQTKDNHMTDYGFVPFRQPPTCSSSLNAIEQTFSRQKQPTNCISWKTDGDKLEVLHV